MIAINMTTITTTITMTIATTTLLLLFAPQTLQSKDNALKGTLTEPRSWRRPALRRAAEAAATVCIWAWLSELGQGWYLGFRVFRV